MSRVYLITLAKDTESRLAPRSDEVGKAEKKKEKEKEKEAEEKKSTEKKTAKETPTPTPPPKVKIDIDGIHDRLVALDIQPADYSNLRLVDDRIFYLRRTVADDKDADDDDGGGDRKFHLCSYSLEDRKETVHGEVKQYEITRDGKKMLVKIDKDYAMIDLPKDKLETKDEKSGKDYKIKLEGLDMRLDRHAEWNQRSEERRVGKECRSRR